MISYPDSLSDLYERYDIFFCDVWGVLHNGISAHSLAVQALEKARKTGKSVFLLTNSPRLKKDVAAQLATFGITSSCYDEIITAGDLTRNLIKMLPKKIFHIGPLEKEECLLFNGLDIVSVTEHEALAIVCTGLFDNKYLQLPKNYYFLLQRLRNRNLPFVCANPDEKIYYGKTIVWCAGSLARIYKELGGEVLISGKPNPLIYNFVCNIAEKITKNPINLSRVLAIGDNFMTDVYGAFFFGIDVLFIARGIHGKEYMNKDKFDIRRFELFLTMHTEKPTFCMLELV